MLSMGKHALDLLGYEDINDFLSFNTVFSNSVVGYEKSGDSELLQALIQAGKLGKKLELINKNKEKIQATLIATNLTHESNKSIYGIEIKTSESVDDNDVESLRPKLRLPILMNSDILISQSKLNKTNLTFNFNEEWISQNATILGLDKKEYIDYLIKFTKNVDKYIIPFQNSIITQDVLNVKKMLYRVKEPAQNFRVAPLVNIINTALEAKSINYLELIVNITACLNSLRSSVSKFQDK